MAATQKVSLCEVCRKVRATDRIRLTTFGPLVQVCGKCRQPKKAKR